jgi:Ca-activated chloride channel homolog
MTGVHTLQFSVDTYWPLICLVILPFLWWAQQTTRTYLKPKHLFLCGVVRSTIALLLIAALMQPVIKTPRERLSVVYMMDLSWSVSPSAIQSAIEWIQKANETGRPAHKRFIAFGANSIAFDTLEQLKDVNIADRPGMNSIDQTSTNVREAIEHAIASFSPDHLKHLVLFTDGNENMGRMAKSVDTLKRENVKLYTVPLGQRNEGDVWIESVSAPSPVDAEEQFQVTVEVYSQSPVTGEITIRNGSRMLASRRVPLTAGLNRIQFETEISNASGPVTLEAEARVDNDPFVANNRFREGITVLDRPKILYAEGHKESSPYLARALNVEGLATDIVTPDQIPSSVEKFGSYDAVILSDVPRAILTDQQMDSIRTYVRDIGGGLVFAGGESSFGREGFYGTALEKALPVTFETKKQSPVALVVVFDKSGSMAGAKIELAKEAVKASAALLKDTDRFGLVAFDQEFYWPVPLQSAANKEAIRQAISTIAPGGETNMYPPLRDAFMQLKDARSDIKHVILVSDGVSIPGDFETLIKQMVQARITVSTVGLGASSDRTFLADAARWGTGRSNYIEDDQKVTQILTEETQLATRITLREGAFKPLVRKDVHFLRGIDVNATPPLLGYVATTHRDNSEIILESNSRDPILARWQYGLGKAVAVYVGSEGPMGYRMAAVGQLRKVLVPDRSRNDASRRNR